MLERYLKLKEIFYLYANENRIRNISPEECEAIESCGSVLQLFEETTPN